MIQSTETLQIQKLGVKLARATRGINLNHIQFQVDCGTVALTWNSKGQISRLDWYETRTSAFALSADVPSAVGNWIQRIRGFFGEGIPLGEIDWDKIDQSGWTQFQWDVYRAIALIPHGETRTYGWVASRIGKLNATRAVGQALRNNPIPIIIPCHRVVAVGSIGGFMGVQDPAESELRLKQRLIAVETEYLNPVFSFCAQPAQWGHLSEATGAF